MWHCQACSYNVCIVFLFYGLEATLAEGIFNLIAVVGEPSLAEGKKMLFNISSRRT